MSKLSWNPETERVEELEDEIERLYIDDDRLDIEEETGLDLPEKE